MEGDGSVQVSAVCSVLWCVVLGGGECRLRTLSYIENPKLEINKVSNKISRSCQYVWATVHTLIGQS